MKTLDEVIKALEICHHVGNVDCSPCPYYPGKGWCEEKDADALFYLKEYRWIQENCADTLAKKYPSENIPLTWEQLKTMEGKPVWVEWYDHKEWFLIDAIDDNEVVFRAQNGFGWNCQNGNATWQAYRKERNGDT